MTDEVELEELLRPFTTTKEMCFARIQRLYEMSKTVNSDPSLEAVFTARVQDLNSIRTDFERCSSEINSLSRKYKKRFVPSYKDIEAFDELYYTIRSVANILNVKDSSLINDKRSEHERRPRVKLPEIQLFKFDGKVENWSTFHDTFKSLIHNNADISDIEKYYYLLSSVSGPALSIVRSMPVNADNYAIVWSALISRYENKRALATAYLDKLFTFKPISSESAYNLNTFLNTFNENIKAIEKLHIPDLSSFILFYISLRNLDPVTRRAFEQSVSPGHIPEVAELLSFVERQARILEMTECKPVSKPVGPKPVPSKPPLTSPRYSEASKTFNQKPTLSSGVASNRKSESKSIHPCRCCQKPHSVHRCPDYNDLTPELRTAKVKELKLCENCLRDNHTTEDCTSKYSCMVCKNRHHTTLHIDSTKSVENVVALACSTVQTVLLGTAVIHVADAWGQYHTVRALIDSGAMSSYITRSCAAKLGLTRRKCDFVPIGLGGNRVQNLGITTCTLKPRHSSEPVLVTDAVVVSNIAGDLPTMSLPDKIVQDYQNLVLADPMFNKPAPVELLIAGDLFPHIYNGNKILPDKTGMPVAMESIFGFIIAGQVDLNNPDHRPTALSTADGLDQVPVFCGTSSNHHNLDQVMNTFWDIEDIPSGKPMKPDDILAEELFVKECSRDESGRFTVKYPLRSDQTLGDSRQMAIRRLINLEKRLDREPQLKSEYHKFMQEYETLGHMTRLGSLDEVESKYLIPHFCILKPCSTTTKLRTVFDASCRTTNNKSLNDIVLPGPKLQVDINKVLINFRLHEICMSADICKMYRQIVIHKEQRPLQHILWRGSAALLQVYELNTVTYGVASSPYLAIKVLHTLAEAEADSYPLAARVLKSGFYMDDLLWSEPNIEDALKLQADLCTVLGKAGFTLRKWASNASAVLAAVPQSHRETPLEFDEDQTSLKVLGLQWQPGADCFSFRAVSSETQITKRSILSQIGRLFDPLGFVAPCIFYAKSFMQKLWIKNIDWDDPLPSDLEKEWSTYVAELPLLSNLRHDRQATVKGHSQYQLVGFCDASTAGYAAVIYLRSLNDTGDIKVSLLIAKSKVAPLKTISVPRLELMAAHLLAKLLKYTKSILLERIPIHEVYLFTDSSVVLAWLNTPAYNLKTFVATRVTKILETTSVECWSHVIGCANPADVCSRGALPSSLVQSKEWLDGPDWLYTLQEGWPVKQIDQFKTTNVPELKQININLVQSCENQEPNYIFEVIEKYSKFSKLINVIARCWQFIDNCRAPKSSRTIGVPSIATMSKAHDSLIKVVQSEMFATEIDSLIKGSNLVKSLKALCPFIDTQGLLRVGGRLSASSLPYGKKHPLLLPKKCHLTCLIIDYYHKTHLHVGPRTLQSLLMQKYWIISARSVIRSRISKCVPCFKAKPTTLQPLMGSLPKFRCQDIHAFHTVGVDIGGPFFTKESNRRNAKVHKAYLCLFVCCATRAVHLEALTALSTECFLATFDRFTSRRGLCNTVVSDNGRNFTAAGRHLKEVAQFYNENFNQLSHGFNARQITWKYNPPAGSHFGGLYESGIKSAKLKLKRVIGDRSLTFEELSTLLSRVEAVLNSRPLVALSSDPHEYQVLTPGHFLVGRELLAVPEYPLSDEPTNRLTRWQYIQQASQRFWALWRQEYLHTLQQRSKWTSKCRDIKVNDLVLLHSDAPPLHWPLGRVTQVFPGPDGVVRVVKVRTPTSEYTRPVVKLSPLPMEQDF